MKLFSSRVAFEIEDPAEVDVSPQRSSAFFKEYNLFLEWTHTLKISMLRHDANAGKVQLCSSQTCRLYHYGRLTIHLCYVIMQIAFLKLTLQEAVYSTEVMLRQLAWISGPMYAITPYCTFVFGGKRWCGVLNEVFRTEEYVLGNELMRKVSSMRYNFLWRFRGFCL